MTATQQDHASEFGISGPQGFRAPEDAPLGVCDHAPSIDDCSIVHTASGADVWVHDPCGKVVPD